MIDEERLDGLITERLKADALPSAPPGLLDLVLNRIDATPQRGPRRFEQAMPGLLAAAALVALAVVVGTWLLGLSGPPVGNDPSPASNVPSPTASGSSPGAEPIRPDPPASIPVMTAFDGAAGEIVGWCWDGRCVDVDLDFQQHELYPAVTSVVRLAADVAHIEAEILASPSERRSVDVTTEPDGFHLVPTVPGDWRIVVVSVEFEDGNQASYAWRAVRGVRVGVDTDQVAVYEPLVEVLPPVGRADATVEVVFEDGELLGIEGAILFLKATDQHGSVILDRMVKQGGDEERLPAGHYTFSAYYRTCDGSCAYLDQAKAFCSVPGTLAASARYRLVVSMAQRSCEVGSAAE